MLKPKRSRRGQVEQNPISAMEQFYLNQYFQSASSQYHPATPRHPFATNQNVQAATEIEMRIARIEQYLGLPPL